jgi:hypothetical protein
MCNISYNCKQQRSPCIHLFTTPARQTMPELRTLISVLYFTFLMSIMKYKVQNTYEKEREVFYLTTL